MALFGGDDEGNGRQSGGGVLDFLWKAVKFAAIAVLAVATLGAIFSWSPRAKTFVDNLTGSEKEGDGNGLATWVLGIGSSIKRTVSDVVNPPATQEDYAATDKIRDKYVMPVATDLVKNDIVQHPRDYSPLQELKAKRSAISDDFKLNEAERDAKREDLDKKRDDAMKYGLSIEAYNNSIADYRTNNIKGSVPIPDEIALPLPKLSPALEKFGREAVGGSDWDAMATTPLRRIYTIEREINTYKKDDPKFQEATGFTWLMMKFEGKETFSLRDGARYSRPNSITSTTAMSDVIGLYPVDGILSDNRERYEATAHKAIHTLVNKGRFEEALIVTDGIIKEFNKIGERFVRENKKDNDGKSNAQDEDFIKKQDHYRPAMARLEEIKKQIVLMQVKDEFEKEGGVSDQTYKAINNAAKNAPDAVNKYRQKLDIFKKTGMVSDATGTTPPSAPAASSSSVSATEPATTPVASSTPPARTPAEEKARREALNKEMSHGQQTSSNEGFLNVAQADIPVNTPAPPAKKASKEFGIGSIG